MRQETPLMSGTAAPAKDHLSAGGGEDESPARRTEGEKRWERDTSVLESPMPGLRDISSRYLKQEASSLQEMLP